MQKLPKNIERILGIVTNDLTKHAEECRCLRCGARDQIIGAIQVRDAEALGEGVEPYNVEHPHYEKFVEQYNVEEALRSEIEERLRESLKS